ncbi:MAG TPA: hypothetical protein VFF86_04120 [Candidatus Methylomirabilis sp.]|nr:hypothetical protein [Candidatus Methylomirabilis sp.]
MDALTILIALGILYLIVFFKTARIILGLTLLGAVLGACVALVALSNAFVPWEPLGTPPSGAVKITQVADDRIYVKAADAETYSCDFASQIQCWVRAQPLDPKLTDDSRTPSYSYGATPEVSVSEQRASITYWHFEGGGSRRQFELRANGSVWTKFTGGNAMISLAILAGGPLAGTILGFLGSVLLVIVRFLRKRARAEVAPPESSEGI